MGKKKKDKKKNKHKDEEKSSAAAGAEKSSIKFDLRSVELPPRPKPMKAGDIRELRRSLNASQTLFARLLNVSSNAVESWEQGVREPRQATLKLLHVARKNPEVLLS
ncbi:MAG TPA: helix-turn-helix domain-containing protein [Terriglobales bacterium]|nr:helix-turn-helix domain-containing protein [Terriglobales bacterium]